MVLEEFKNGKNNVVDVAEAGCFALLCVMESPRPVDCNVCCLNWGSETNFNVSILHMMGLKVEGQGLNRVCAPACWALQHWRRCRHWIAGKTHRDRRTLDNLRRHWTYKWQSLRSNNISNMCLYARLLNIGQMGIQYFTSAVTCCTRSCYPAWWTWVVRSWEAASTFKLWAE